MSVNTILHSGWVVVPEVRALRETVHGVKTHYVFAGEGEPLIMIHGGGPGASGSSGWANTIPDLAKHFRVYAIDLIGNGQSDKPLVEYSFQTQVEHVAGIIDVLNLPKVRIMGNSQGAYVAIKYALDNPGHVKQAALISTATLADACGISACGKAEPLPRFDGNKESLHNFMKVIVNDPSKITEEWLDAGHRKDPGIPGIDRLIFLLPCVILANRKRRQSAQSARAQLRFLPNETLMTGAPATPGDENTTECEPVFSMICAYFRKNPVEALFSMI